MNATKQPQIAIVGSINMDLVVRVDRLPRAGETIHGNQLLQIPGGKGANQAVAVAQLGGRAQMIGRVGDDGFGPTLVSSLESHHVDTTFVATKAGCSSGVAVISVEESGENSITIIGGANQHLTVEDVTNCEQAIASADVLLVQLETPVDTVATCDRVGSRPRRDHDPGPCTRSNRPPARPVATGRCLESQSDRGRGVDRYSRSARHSRLSKRLRSCMRAERGT